jgi:hypothetical protein
MLGHIGRLGRLGRLGLVRLLGALGQSSLGVAYGSALTVTITKGFSMANSFAGTGRKGRSSGGEESDRSRLNSQTTLLFKIF